MRSATVQEAFFIATPFWKGATAWINSYIVFQHIPPRRGAAILETLLDRLELGGMISLHFTTRRDVGLLRKAGRRALQVLSRRGAILMYEYDLNLISALCYRRGFEELMLVHTGHGGHQGVEIYGRRR
jgi:hypothetical protein